MSLRQLILLSERDRPDASAMTRLEDVLKSLAQDKSDEIMALVNEVIAQRFDSLNENVDFPLQISSSLPSPTLALLSSSSSLDADFPSQMSSFLPSTTLALSSSSPSLDAQQLTSNPNLFSAIPPTPPAISLKRARGGNIDLIERKQLATLNNSASKLEILLHIASIVPANKEELTCAARAFYNQILKPLLHCFNDHHRGDKAAFLDKLGPNFKPTHFKKPGCGCVPSPHLTIPD